MAILAHRGLWEKLSEQNSLEAFDRAIKNGFGIETDLRDHQGECVIAHNLPCTKDAKFSELLSLVDGTNYEIALNIKSSGLSSLIKSQVQDKNLPNSYFFDHAFPDLLEYLKADLPVLTRASEYENLKIKHPQIKGIWVDDFSGRWLTEQTIENLLETKLKLHFVSPELHGHDHVPLWQKIKDVLSNQEFSICTDLPFEARTFFND